MSDFEKNYKTEQQKRNEQLVESSYYMKGQIKSEIIPFHINIEKTALLTGEQENVIKALEIHSAKTALKALASLAKINELDHLGGGLDLIPAFVLTIAITDLPKIDYTIEHAHTSIGYFSVLSSFGYLDESIVTEKFRRGLDIAGHVAWLPGGTQLNGGRLGVMIPAAIGQALGKKAIYGKGSWVITHCGDAGWISGQALNGFNAADLHGAPVTFIMHRNGIQLSGTNQKIMNKDPRSLIASMGITILEVQSLYDLEALYLAYREGYQLAQDGRPSMIYPTGFHSGAQKRMDLNYFGELYGIPEETKKFAEKNKVPMENNIWIPGSLMSYRDVEPMLECLFLVNNFEGGKGHHDGHMKGRDLDKVLFNPMLTMTEQQEIALKKIKQQPKINKTTNARLKPGSKNLILPEAAFSDIELPLPGKSISPRAGSEVGYAAIAKSFPANVFVVSCDLDPSTKLEKAKSFLDSNHKFEMGIEEQASALMTNGLALSSDRPQLNIFSTFAAFFEGIAREGFEMWRYQRNLNGSNEGLNVVFHLSHVGACTGRDHFSGWSLNWINLALDYLPYLNRFYAPADARQAFISVIDLAAHYGGHIIGVPRDNLPVLEKQDGSGPLWNVNDQWEAITSFRKYDGAKKAIFALGAPAFLADTASQKLKKSGEPVDVFIVNGFPVNIDIITKIIQNHPKGIVSIEDGLIGDENSGVRGFAGFISNLCQKINIPAAHIGIVDPRIAPADGHMEVWEHFGITVDSIIAAVESF